jgi:glutathione-specific gamma-glutamylcyclotransferase
MLTRQAIDSGMYLQHFESAPNLWTLDQITASLEQTMRARPAKANDVWLFAYGSLMWNPMVEFSSQEVGMLQGWHRSFCLAMSQGRASPDQPGRMLALREGGSTSGIALRLPESTLDEELTRVWIREMVLGSYRPVWADVRLHCGDTVPAVVFVANEMGEQFRPDASVETVAPLIASATGHFGSNLDYLIRLHATLHELALCDAYIDAIAGYIPQHGQMAHAFQTERVEQTAMQVS